MQFKKIISSILFFVPFILLAQKGTISGLVVQEKTSNPIASASVSILSPINQSQVKGQQTAEDGKFTITEVDPGTYTLQVTSVGYETYLQVKLEVAANQNIKLPTITLKEEGKQIEQVVVQGKLPDLQIGIDKKVFDVSQSLVSVGGSAQDLLANVPTLQVESDGAISLRGSSNVRILVDGKESAMAGSDINAFLQSLPADAIAKVEIMTNPSAKHDAEGQSGIVNIILKKNIRTGLNGSVTASGGSYDNYNAGITLNYRPGKLNYFGNYNFAHRKSVGGGFNDNVDYINGAIVDASPRTYSLDENNRKGLNHTIRLGADYYATEKTTFSIAGNLSLRDNDRRQNINYSYWNIPNFGASSFRNSNQLEDDLGIDLQFDFRQQFKREGEEILANISYGNDSEDGTNDFQQTYASGIKDLIRENTTAEKGINWNFQLDYVLPFSQDHKFEAGYRSILRNSDEEQFSMLMDTVSMQFKPDYKVSNNFDMQSGVHALYANYQKKLTEKFGAQIGLRAEQAYLTSTYYNLDPATPVDKRAVEGKLDYFRLYPSIFLSYDVGQGQGDKVQLSYTRRVERPRGWQVNPFLDISDEQNYRQGNPNLLPQDIHALELSFSKFYEKWNFVSSAYYRRVNDMSMPYIYPDSLISDIVGDRSNVTYSKWENVADNNSMGVELISKVNLFKWWDVTANANLFYMNMTPKAGFDARSTSNFNWHGNLTTNFKVLPTLSAQLRGDYRSGMKTLQGEMKDMYGLDLALKKELFNNKANLSFNVRDLFNTRKFEMENYLNDKKVHFSHRWMSRTFTLSFSYRFGIQDMGKKSKNREPEMEDMGGQQF